MRYQFSVTLSDNEILCVSSVVPTSDPINVTVEFDNKVTTQTITAERNDAYRSADIYVGLLNRQRGFDNVE